MDTQRFEDACHAVIGCERERDGIGTLGEKTLHAVLKRYFEPCADCHEIKVGGFVADILGEDGIIEIQTAGFDRLRKKLAAFLDCTRVTVVYPIPQTKYLCWIDPATGAVTKKRKSPKTGTVCDAFYELYKIKPLLLHPHLRLCFVLLEMTEYRYLNGWSADKKKGSSRHDRIPTALRGELYAESASDYAALLPDALPPAFISKDLARSARLSRSSAQKALNVLYHIGAVRRVGKQGNAIVYERCEAGIPPMPAYPAL